MDEHSKKLPVDFRVFVWATLVCVCVLALRVVYAGVTGYLFLLWNLFLAWLPLLFADAAQLFYVHRNKVRFWLFFFLWLIFFPNAPYILTDFAHLRFWATVGVPTWFDFLMIGAFAVTGILLGLASLQVAGKIFAERFGAFWSWFFLVAVSFLTGFGIYVGRYLRWNSWDVILHPRALVTDIVGGGLDQPLAQYQPWIFTFLFGALLLSSYLVFSHFCHYRHRHQS